MAEYVAPCPKCYLQPVDGVHELLPHPWRAEVSVPGESHWAGNNLTFVSRAEADAYGFDLTMRWTAVRDYRAVDESVPKKEPLS